MPQQPVVIIVMGVAGSGKSTIGRRLAAQLDWAFHDADDDHSPQNIQRMKRGVPLTEAHRQPWLQTLHERIVSWLRDTRRTILACSALTAEARSTLSGGDARVRFVYLRGSREMILQRMAAREHFMPATLLDSQLELLEEPHGAVVVDASQSPEEVVERIRAGCGV